MGRLKIPKRQWIPHRTRRGGVSRLGDDGSDRRGPLVSCMGEGGLGVGVFNSWRLALGWSAELGPFRRAGVTQVEQGAGGGGLSLLGREGEGKEGEVGPVEDRFFFSNLSFSFF